MKDISASSPVNGQAMDIHGDRAPIYTDAWRPGVDGLNFYTRTYNARTPNPQASILFVHGFAEYIAEYEWLHSQYAASGITVFAFDQRGFDYTALEAAGHEGKRNPKSRYAVTSWKKQLADIEWWLKYVSNANPGLPVFLVGPSMVGSSIHLIRPFSQYAEPSDTGRRAIAGICVAHNRAAGTGERVARLWCGRDEPVPPADGSHSADLKLHPEARERHRSKSSLPSSCGPGCKSLPPWGSAFS